MNRRNSLESLVTSLTEIFGFAMNVLVILLVTKLKTTLIHTMNIFLKWVKLNT